jgi:AraC family transcriptional regulator
MTTNHAREAVIRAETANYYGAVRRRLVVRGLHMSETVYGADTRIPSHQHECPSLFMPLGGAFVEGCTGMVRSYVPGDVSYHPPYEAHWLDTRGGPARGFAIEIGAEWCDALGGGVAWDGLARDLSTARVAWVVGRLYYELRAHDSTRTLAIESLGVELGTQLADTKEREDTRASASRAPLWIGRVREALHAAGRVTPSLAELARMAGVTPVAVIKGFRRHIGRTPGVYLRDLRLANARRALADDTRPLSVVALDAGFYDQSHFSRAFRAAAGISPQAYRRVLHGQ